MADEAASGGRAQGPLLACLAFLLSGCLTTTPTPVQTVPHTLSEAEIGAVASGMRAAVKDLDAPKFRSFKSSRSAAGKTYVCGWMTSRKDGYYTEEQPFFGTIEAGQFDLGQIGADHLAASKVFNECRLHGIIM